MGWVDAKNGHFGFSMMHLPKTGGEEFDGAINSLLKRCGIDHFDMLLVHAQNVDTYAKYQKL